MSENIHHIPLRNSPHTLQDNSMKETNSIANSSNMVWSLRDQVLFPGGFVPDDDLAT